MTSSTNRQTRHLDLGCGSRPRNPYAQDELFGVDIQGSPPNPKIEIRQANIAIGPLPFPESYFDSVSAYDFLEHVPRIFPTINGTRFPFVELMNEIWRVLVNGGLFYASTPAFPHPSAFQDPTHVNILTRESHIYFTQPTNLARMYGFSGNFSIVRVIPVRGGEFEYESIRTPNLVQKLMLWQREKRGKNSHLVWEFRAIK